MKYTIIEDCSPYYIRFTYDGIEEFTSRALQMFYNQTWTNSSSKKHPGFSSCKLSHDLGKELLSVTPLSLDFPLRSERVCYFTTQPGAEYPAHKDGVSNRFSINYNLKVSDTNCITNWYAEGLDKFYTFDQQLFDDGFSREFIGFDKTKHAPVKTMTAAPNECVLFNTDIWHSWDNSNSTNDRIILTLRVTNSDSMYFDDAKKILAYSSVGRASDC